MYNLLISASDEDWAGGPFDLPRGRVLEYTEEAIVGRFNDLRVDQLEQLQALPALFAYERPNQKDARVGRVTGINILNREVRVFYEFDAHIAPVPHHILDDQKRALDIGDWELNRTHWAVKDVDLIAFLEAHELVIPGQADGDDLIQLDELPAPEPIPISPTAFRIPDEPSNPQLVSLMMPFAPEFEGMMETVRAACHAVGLVCLNASEVWNHDEIIQDIFSLIFRSRIVICDFTTQNPNVFYEAGIAHTLGRPLIPITRDINALPFDLRHRRALVYSADPAGLATLRADIIPRLQRLLDLG